MSDAPIEPPLDTLLAALREGTREEVWEAAKAIDLLGDPRAVPPLIELLVSAAEPEPRAAAAYTLGMLGDDGAVDALMARLADSQEEVVVREHAAEALAQMPVSGPRRDRLVQLLIAMLRDPAAEVRFWSAFALGQLGDPLALPELERLAANDTAAIPGWWTVGKEAADAIEQIKGAE